MKLHIEEWLAALQNSEAGMDCNRLEYGGCKVLKCRSRHKATGLRREGTCEMYELVTWLKSKIAAKEYHKRTGRF